MDRTIIDPLEQMRDFDFVQFEHDVLVALGGLAQDVLSGNATTVVGGLIASQTNVPTLNINISAGRVYQLASADATSVGSIAADSTIITQQGIVAPQVITLVAPATGQSQWNLIQASFSQVDVVRPGDPTSGVVPFYNASNPTVPNPTSINTCRQGRCVLQVISGAAATTGSEVPPNPTSGWAPLYLIDLAGGQTQITTAQILKAGPSVGTGVPSNYPQAGFIAGLLASHHGGGGGQAPKINLSSEVQGVLPYSNMSPVRTLLGAPLTLYVNTSTGSDSNPGTSPSQPFATIAAAIKAANTNYDFNNFSLTISVANGTYTVSGTNAWIAAFNSMPLGCSSINFTGNISSPGSVVLNATNANALLVNTNAIVTAQGFTITATGTGNGVSTLQGIGARAANGGYLNIYNCIMGSCGYGQCLASNGGVLSHATQSMTLTGSTPASYIAQNSGFVWIVGSTITVTGLTVSTGFASVSACASLDAVSNTFVGSATGPKFVVNLNGVIATSGSGVGYLPGSTAGSTASGGQYS